MTTAEGNESYALLRQIKQAAIRRALAEHSWQEDVRLFDGIVGSKTVFQAYSFYP